MASVASDDVSFPDHGLRLRFRSACSFAGTRGVSGRAPVAGAVVGAAAGPATGIATIYSTALFSASPPAVRRAARLIQRNHFDLVICDRGLPSSGGMALINFVKLQAPETFVVLAMDKLDALVRSRAILQGALECYAKPISDEAVRLLILHVRSGSKMNPDGETAMRPVRRRGGRK